MRGLLIPAQGEPSVIEQAYWPLEAIQEFLEADPMYAIRMPHRAPSGRHLITYSGSSADGWWLSLLQRRPILVFALADAGHPTSINRKEVIWLGLVIALEEALPVLPGPSRKELP